jgi:hypothetical protein
VAGRTEKGADAATNAELSDFFPVFGVETMLESGKKV